MAHMASNCGDDRECQVWVQKALVSGPRPGGHP